MHSFLQIYFPFALTKFIPCNLPLHVSDEEEDEEISGPPPTEDTQEDKDEHGEKQEDGKN